MIHAYNETYLNDAMNNLGDMFDYAVNICGYKADDFFTYFISSEIADKFGRGNPKYVAGLSGPELAYTVIYKTFNRYPDNIPSDSIEKSPEYWAGWALAYYQWLTSARFIDLNRKGLNMEYILSLYPTLHEADITKFVNIVHEKLRKHTADDISNLQRMRKVSGLTQKELAEISGTALRMISLYEQRNKDINKAQVGTLVRLSNALKCDILDLIE
jgi:DNA-binding transcriptional regulator YiaG